MITIISIAHVADDTSQGVMAWAWTSKVENETADNGSANDNIEVVGGANKGSGPIADLCATLDALRTHRSSGPLIIKTNSQYVTDVIIDGINGVSTIKTKTNRHLVDAIKNEIQQRKGEGKREIYVKHQLSQEAQSLAETAAVNISAGKQAAFLPKEAWRDLIDKKKKFKDGLDYPEDAEALVTGRIDEKEYRKQHGYS